MSTHTIGTGKRNLTTTFNVEEARRIGRTAYVLGYRSRNEWMRKVVLEALRNAGKVGLIAITLGVVLTSILQGDDLRRPSRPVRGARRKWEETV